MKTHGLFLLFFFCTLAELACRSVLFACDYLEKATCRAAAGLVIAKRRLCAEHLLMKRKKSGRQEREVPRTMAFPATKGDVVGASRTVFITELPVLIQQEIKPFKSEPLKMVPQRDDEDDRMDAPEAAGAYEIDTAPVGKEDMEDFEPGDDGEEPAGSSSGVSFEELSETIGVLAKEHPSEAEKQKATSVLYNIDGTELFNFIALNEIYTQKARAMMAAFNGNADMPPGGFDMNEYME